MTPQIASGTGFDAPNAGVGAVFTGDEDVYSKVKGAYDQNYALANQWQKEQDAAAAAKAAKLKTMLGDLSLDTTGINPNHLNYFQAAKQKLNDFMVDSYNNNVDPNDPKFLAHYQALKGAQQGYKTLIDLSKQHNKQAQEDYKSLEADKTGVYDWDKSVAGIASEYKKPLELVAGMHPDVPAGVRSGLVRNDFDAKKYADERLKPLKPNKGTYVNPSGQTIETEEFLTPEPELAKQGVNMSRRGLQELQGMYGNSQFAGKVLKDWNQLPEARKAQYADTAKTFTDKGLVINPEEVFAYGKYIKPSEYSGAAGKGYSPYATAYGHESGKEDAEKKQYAFDAVQMAQEVGDSEVLYHKDANQDMVLTNPATEPVKTYTTVVNTKNGPKTETEKATILSVKHFGVPGHGEDKSPLIKVTDSYSVKNPNNAALGTDENGAYKMQAKDYVQMILRAKYGANWNKPYQAFLDLMKEKGAYNNGSIDITSEGLNEILHPSGYNPVNQDEAIKENSNARPVEFTGTPAEKIAQAAKSKSNAPVIVQPPAEPTWTTAPIQKAAEVIKKAVSGKKEEPKTTTAKSTYLLNDLGYKAIDDFENSKGTSAGTSMNKGDGYSRTQEAQISQRVNETIGLDTWEKLPDNLKAQAYSFAFNNGYEKSNWLKGLAQAYDPKVDRASISESDAIGIIKKNAGTKNDEVYKRYINEVLPSQYQSIAKSNNKQDAYEKSWKYRPQYIDKSLSGSQHAPTISTKFEFEALPKGTRYKKPGSDKLYEKG